jgi:hypothetical protein
VVNGSGPLSTGPIAAGPELPQQQEHDHGRPAPEGQPEANPNNTIAIPASTHTALAPRLFSCLLWGF